MLRSTELRGEVRTLTERGIGLFIVGQSSYLFMSKIRGTRSVESHTVDLSLDSVVLLSWICSLTLSPGEQTSSCAGCLAGARLAVRAVLSRETLSI